MPSYMDLEEAKKITRAITALEDMEGCLIDCHTAAQDGLDYAKSALRDLEDALNEIMLRYERSHDPQYKY